MMAVRKEICNLSGVFQVHLLHILIRTLLMSSNAVADRIEFYMDELIDSFEDFVKKSLVLITLALASVVIMAMYVMKMAQQNRNNRAVIRGNNVK